MNVCMKLSDPGRQGRPTRQRPGIDAGRSPWWLEAAKELFVVGVLYALYKLGRQLAVGQEHVARANARVVHTLEDQLGLPSGAPIQGWLTDGALHLANVYYVVAHFPVTLAFLIWGFTVRPRAEYVWGRAISLSYKPSSP